eukprot:TRINITY_DN7950_c0_g1_i1.p1 TRINITY_DN7950_c0_g1~~TRINITY_DN7950_c0_g1_i1.p1  ORF type:complete len:246 (-),score=34.76 TRINITY_DN7950_c0_g1_i1:238-975(-)
MQPCVRSKSDYADAQTSSNFSGLSSPESPHLCLPPSPSTPGSGSPPALPHVGNFHHSSCGELSVFIPRESMSPLSSPLCKAESTHGFVDLASPRMGHSNMQQDGVISSGSNSLMHGSQVSAPVSLLSPRGAPVRKSPVWQEVQKWPQTAKPRVDEHSATPKTMAGNAEKVNSFPPHPQSIPRSSSSTTYLSKQQEETHEQGDHHSPASGTGRQVDALGILKSMSLSLWSDSDHATAGLAGAKSWK